MDMLDCAFCVQIAEYTLEGCKAKHGLRCLHKNRNSALIWMNDESFILDLLSSCEDGFMAEAIGLEVVTPCRLCVEVPV